MPPKERSGVHLRGESFAVPIFSSYAAPGVPLGGVGVDMSEPPVLQMAEAQASGKQ